ncbi:MAG: hypothetical protein ABI837_11965 [Acidobacteriota bacterium]
MNSKRMSVALVVLAAVVLVIGIWAGGGVLWGWLLAMHGHGHS